jgi:chemotaxis signal transduction protein
MKLYDDAAALRAAFDGTFALPPPPRADAVERLLGLRLAGDAWALRLAEIAALVAGRKIVPVPSGVAAVLGVASIRGDVVAVYSLAALLGYARPTTPPRWLAVLRDPEPVGVAFAELDGYFEAGPGELQRAPPADSERLAGLRAPLHAVARVHDRSVSVLDVAALLSTMKRRVAEAGARKER